MPNIKQAADDLNAVTNRLKGLIRVQSALEELGDLEAAANEYKHLKEQAMKDCQEAKKALEEIHDRIQKARAAAESAEARVPEIILAANKRADAIVVEANGVAASIKKEGEKSRDLINKQIGELNIVVASINTDIQTKKNELEAVRAAIRESKSKIASL
jgi:chromosome segregation ATPase